MGETGFVVVFLYPCGSVVVADGEGVHFVEGSEVMEVGQQDKWSKPFVGIDRNVSGVFEEAETAHGRHEADTVPSIDVFPFLSENSYFVSYAQCAMDVRSS